MITNNIIILLLAIVIIILAVISYLEFKKFKIEINKLIEDNSNLNYKVNKLLEAVFMNELDQNAPVIKKQSKNIVSDDVNIIWGTIDQANISSMRTAEKVGRKIIRSEYFIPVNLL